MKFIPIFTTDMIITGLITCLLLSRLLMSLYVEEALALLFGACMAPFVIINLGDSDPPLIIDI